MKNKLVLLLISLILPATGIMVAVAQPNAHADELAFDRYEWSNMVGNTSIYPNGYLQDSRGMMWMATSSGLVSFDGYNFRIFNAQKHHLTTSSMVRLAEDLYGNIWVIGIRNSRIVINVMNPKTEMAVPLHQYVGQDEPIEILLSEDIPIVHNIAGRIWVGSTSTVYSYDGQWKQVYNLRGRKKPADSWWPAPNGGVWSINIKNRNIYYENNEGTALDSVSSTGDIWVDNQLRLWLKKMGDTVYYQLATTKERIIVAYTSQLPTFQWISESIHTSGTDTPLRYGYEWKISRSDLYLRKVSESGATDTGYKSVNTSPNSMFYIDRQGGIWTSSRNSIIRLTEKHPAGFQTYLKDENLDRSIRGMIQIGNQLYVSSYKGDCRINTKNGSVSAFNILYGQGLCFLADGKGCWAGGHGGKLIYLEPGRPNTHYTFERRADIYTFLQSDDGILIGSSNGLFRINRQQHTVTPLPFQNISIDYLYRNHKGIWACTADGLYLINEHGYVVTHYLARTADLNYNRLTCLYEDEKGDFWISTRGGGLIHWSADRGIIRQFTESDGLSSNDIHAVYADTRGFLWLPGNYGLMRLHRESGRIQVFFKRDGIADNEFNALSHYQAPDGRLYFGGVNGITAFYPDDIPIQETRTPQLRLIEARTFQIKSGEFVNHLPDVYGGGPIVVTPGDDYLDIRISPLVYEDINRIKYSWKLDGYSDQWIQQQEPLIRLHNLPYGKHQLHIRYSLQGNIWSENELIIPVFVERPFYLSWPFLTTMTLCILGIAWGAGNWRATQLRKANLQLEQEVKSRTRQIEADKQVIEQQARELRSLDEVKSRFFANVTHELRTPLTLIIGPADSILRANITPEKKMEYIQTIRRNATRLLNLVEELLDLSRMEANSISVVEKPTRLYQFLARLTAAFAPYAEHRGIELNLQFKCPVSTTLMMDVPKWEKIINNLLNNAIKFTPGGGAVIITAEIKDEKMIISVEDTGSGIHPDDMPFIFDRYYQSRMENASLQGGAGIGLSLCHEYMKLFGGEISVQSEPGKGSRFTLSRPLALSSAVETVEFPDQHDEIATIPSATRPSHQPGKYTLLLVEDDRDMSEYIQHIIESEYNLLTADNGKSALQILENNQVDLVLSDVMMPQMDGFQLLEAVRERFGDLPFIMLTARSEPPDRLQALRMGVDDYITKPFLQEELSTRIANLLKYLRIRKNARIGPDIPDNETGYDQKWLAQLEQIVVEHIHNTDFSVEMMADLLHISRRSLFYKLRSCTGMTPNQYLTEVRLNRARYLIETGAFQTISEVCYAVGFKTPHYFSKLMKERFGERL